MLKHLREDIITKHESDYLENLKSQQNELYECKESLSESLIWSSAYRAIKQDLIFVVLLAIRCSDLPLQ